MSDKLLFLTGRLAEPRLSVTVAGLGLPPGSWRVANIGIKVAALMTEAIVRNRLKPPLDADRVIVPGPPPHGPRQLGRPLRRALRARAGRNRRPAAIPRPRRQAAADLSKHDLRIFAEIIDAPLLAAELLARRRRHKAPRAPT